jgi:hypothetical protein
MTRRVSTLAGNQLLRGISRMDDFCSVEIIGPIVPKTVDHERWTVADSEQVTRNQVIRKNK